MYSPSWNSHEACTIRPHKIAGEPTLCEEEEIKVSCVHNVFLKFVIKPEGVAMDKKSPGSHRLA